MSQSMPLRIAAAKVPTPHQTESTRYRIADRSGALVEHNNGAILLAARVLSTMEAIGEGGIASLRCEHSDRYRRYQFCGDKGFPVEDICAVGLESDLGRQVVVAGMAVLLSDLGHSVAPTDAPSLSIHENVAAMAEALGGLISEFTLAAKDGRFDRDELDRMAHWFEKIRNLAIQGRAVAGNSSTFAVPAIPLVRR